MTLIYGDRRWNQQSSVGGGEPSGEKEMFYVLMGVVVTQVYTFVETPLIIHFRSLHFTVYNYSLILKHARESQWRKPLAFLSLIREDFTNSHIFQISSFFLKAVKGSALRQSSIDRHCCGFITVT